MSVSEMLCRRVLLPVCMLYLYESENMFAGYCDALRCMRYAFVAAPSLHAMPCMHVHTGLHLRLIELAMLIIFSMPVKFHAYRWGS